MNVVNLALRQLVSAPWNPNSMDAAMLDRLRASIHRYGLLIPLVVRPVGKRFEVLSGNQRMTVVAGLGFTSVPCIVLEVDDAHARLLAQALNHLNGEDDLGLRAELMRTVLEHLPQEDVLAVLPESAESLRELATLGDRDMAGYLQDWQRAKGARLHHFTAQLTSDQLSLVRDTLKPFLARVTLGDGGNPNRQGLALLRLCETYREIREGRE